MSDELSVPWQDLLRLDPDQYKDGTGWNDLWRFARSFDGYAFFGGDREAPQRLWDFDQSVRDAFAGDGKLPELPLDLLRACLFVEERRLMRSGAGGRIHPTSIAYLQALLDGIRLRAA